MCRRGRGQADGAEEIALRWRERREPVDRWPLADLDGLKLQASQLLQQPGRGLATLAGLEPPAQHPMQDEGQEAHERVRPDSSGQAVVDRPDLDIDTKMSCKP